MSKYREDPRINASKLKLFAGDYFEPMNAIDSLRHPKPPSEAMKLGTLVHSFVEHRGDVTKVVKDIPMSPFENFRTKEARAWKIENPDYVVQAQVDQAKIMASRIMEITPECKEDKAKMEVDYYTDKYKALLDCVHGDHGFDWKTSAATNARQWERDANKYHYALQAFHYKTIAELEHFSFVAVSSVAPYPVWRFQCTPDYLAYGEHLWNVALERYRRLKDAEVTPEYEVRELSAPAWFESEEDNASDSTFSWSM